MPTKAKHPKRTDLKQGKTLWHIEFDHRNSTFSIARVGIHGPIRKETRTQYSLSKYTVETVRTDAPVYDLDGKRKPNLINAVSVHHYVDEYSRDVNDSTYGLPFFTSWRAANRAVKRLEELKVKYAKTNVHCMGIYPTNDFRTNFVRPADLYLNARYNINSRPGRTYVIDGRVLYWGIGADREKVKAIIASRSKMNIDCSRPSSQYE